MFGCAVLHVFQGVLPVARRVFTVATVEPFLRVLGLVVFEKAALVFGGVGTFLAAVHVVRVGLHVSLVRAWEQKTVDWYRYVIHVHVRNDVYNIYI